MSEPSINPKVSGFHPDKLSTDDQFGRRLFAHRVADVLVQQPLGDCLVASISGEWGAGKSTTMEFVKDRLAETKCKVLDFNPWRFPGEDNLLFELFDRLVKTIDPDQKVLTVWQRFAAGAERTLDPFSSVAGLAADTSLPGVGGAIKSLGDFVRSKLQATVEEVRKQAIEFLQKQKMRVVVLIDDLDRLEPGDLMAMLRIIKLVADLPNTSFIMAMDEDHVARTIGRRIGGGHRNGKLYLEKIIQVILPLPVIPWYRMRDYALGLVYQELADSNASLHPHEKARFEQVFDDLFSFEIKTPRSAKAWSNAVRFTLGLLPEELNTADLMLLECSRLIHSELYCYIRSDLAKTMSEQMNVSRQILGHKDTIVPLLQKLERLFGHCTQQEVDDRRRAFMRWFPNLTEHQTEEDKNEWARNKRLCSRHYFWRYFSATISADDLEDTMVSKLIERAISIQNPAQTGMEIEQELEKDSANAFLLKLRVMGGAQQVAIKPLVLALASVGQNRNVQSSFPHTAIRLCVSLINELPDHSSQDALASECVRNATNLEWAWHLCHTLRSESNRHSNHEQKFSYGLADLAGRILTELQRKVPEDHDLFGKFIWSVWHEGDRESLKTLLSVKLQESPKIAPFLLTSACNMRTSPTPKPPERCWIWNGEKGLIVLEKIIDLQQLMTVLQTHYQSEMIAHEDENGPAMDHDLRTPEQLIPCFFASLQERRAKPDAPSGE